MSGKTLARKALIIATRPAATFRANGAIVTVMTRARQKCDNLSHSSGLREAVALKS